MADSDEESDNSTEEEYDDFINTMKELVKDDKTIRNSMKELKTESKHLFMKSRLLSMKINKLVSHSANKNTRLFMYARVLI